MGPPLVGGGGVVAASGRCGAALSVTRNDSSLELPSCLWGRQGGGAMVRCFEKEEGPGARGARQRGWAADPAAWVWRVGLGGALGRRREGGRRCCGGEEVRGAGRR